MATKKKSSSAASKGDDRQKALDAAMAMIEKDYGKGAVMRLGDDNRPPIKAISSGNTAIDVALGIGGFPRGRIVEIYGPESSGKTTVALHAIASAQKDGGIAAFIDAEHALDPQYARLLGVDTDNLLVSQPDTGEQALEIADMLVRSGAIDIIVVDSVAALTPKAEIEGEMGDSHVGLQARLMSQALRKMTGALYNSGTTAIFINQLREKIGHEQIFVPACSAIIIRDVPADAALWEVPSVLLVKRSDNGTWTPVEGICEPGEEITTTALREVKEEVGLDAKVEALLGVGQSGPVTYPNGDECTFMGTALRVSVADGAEPVISDEENTEAGWFSVAKLPDSVSRRHRLMIADAVAQMKHPRGFAPRMGWMKRSERPGL